MGKRSDFARFARDNYPTPAEAVTPLLPHLGKRVRFCEPCAGAGLLILSLEMAGHVCVDAWDIAPPKGRGPRDPRTVAHDARTTRSHKQIAAYITNPPWSRELLHAIIDNLAAHRPTWLLIDADWIHTRQANGLWQRCALMVSVGRLKWIPDSEHTGKDNCAWYRFDPGHRRGPRIIGRA